MLHKPEKDLDIKDLHFYEGEAVWEQKLQVSPTAKPGPLTIAIPVNMIVCDEDGCIPSTLTPTVKLTVTDAPPTGNARTVDPPPANPPPAAPAGDYAQALAALEGRIVGADAPRNTGLGAFLLTAVAWGLISLVTPCVFPMIPITVAFFLKQSEKQHLNPVLQALVYCGTIIVVLGVAALTLLGVFRQLSVNPWTNVVLGGLFVVLP